MQSKQALVPKLRFGEFEGDWQRNTIEELCSNIASGRSKASDLGEYPLYGSTGQIGICSEFDHDGAKILVARVGANAGHLNLVSGKYGVTDNTLIVEPNELVNIRLVFYFFSQFNLNRLIFGSGQPLITGGLLKKINATLPTLPEQEKIAAFLTSVDDRIDQLKRKKSLLQDYKKGAMQKLFSQELRFKDEQGNDFPDWEEKKLGEIATYRRGSFPQPYGLSKWYDDVNGMPFIQVYDVSNSFKLKPTTKRLISKLAAEQSVFVPQGSIVITIQGSIGRIAITQYNAYCDRTLLIFKTLSESLNKNYFTRALHLLFEYEKQIAVGGTIKTITKEKLTEFKIPMPTLPEQTKIANFLSSLDQKIEQVDTQITQTQTFKKGLLQQMFV